tara:strand:- start:13 stop:1764 length:1752 start_codon:yes stop_codon:yes gene_type:complete
MKKITKKANITPNNKRTYKSLKSSGYINNSAVKDLVDNCIDALTRKYGRENISHGFIEVLVESEPAAREPFEQLDFLGVASVEQKDDLTGSNIRSIKFIDSGDGIEDLAEACRLGSDTEHGEDEVGIYGMGMKTASGSMCKRWIVMTRCEEGGETQCGVFDEEDSFIGNEVFLLDPEEQEEEELNKLFQDYLGDDQTGTIFAMYNFHNLDRDRNASKFADVISNENNMPRTYRKYIDDLNLNINVNGDLLVSADPMAFNNSETLVPHTELKAGSENAKQWARENYFHFDERMEVYEFKNPDDGKVYYYALMPTYQPPKTFGSGGSREGKEAGKPGFSILYNGREIGYGKGHGILGGKTNEYNGLNIELHIFNSEMLKFVGANFTKFGGQIIEPLRALIDDSVDGVRKYCADIYRQNNEAGKVDKANKKLNELLDSFRNYIYDERERLKWKPGMRALMYRHLLEEFGPCNTWEGKPNPPRLSKSGRSFVKIVEDISYQMTEMSNRRGNTNHQISKLAVLQQIYYVTQKQDDSKKKTMSTSQRMTAVLNLSAAYYAGFADSETQKEILGDKEPRTEKAKLKALSE